MHTEALPLTTRGFVRDFIALTKPRLSSLVLCTTAGGVWIAPSPTSWPRAIIVLFGTYLLVAGAQALNCYFERDVDGRMRRTAQRPLPAHRLDPNLALGFGIFAAVMALPMLLLAGNPLACALGVVAFLSYVAVYTPLKQWSTWALPVGAIPGAIPPALGYVSVTRHFDGVALVLFAILFVWQLPHFIAISLYLREDYARGGLKVFALVHGERKAKVTMAATALALAPIPFALVPLGVASPLFGVVSLVFGAGFFAWSLTGFGPGRGARWARGFFLASLGYLTLLFAALAAFPG